MTVNNRNDRPDLTPDEARLVGQPGDLVSEDAVPARPRSDTVMLSIRVERPVFDRLNEIAEASGRTFSEAARGALREFVRGQAGVTYPDPAPSWTNSARKVSEEKRMTWRDDDLRGALDEYEAESRQASMAETAWRSYVDYARRFLAWRTGEYRPRGVVGSGRPVPITAASSADLRQQAGEYARQVEAAGRAQATVDTYYRHAMFFIRWLEGDFRPGARLRGLQ
jgi:hypothetical protein